MSGRCIRQGTAACALALFATLLASACPAASATGDVDRLNSSWMNPTTDICSPADASFAGAVEAFEGIHASSPNDRLSRIVARGLGGDRVTVIDGVLPVLAIPVVALDGIALDPANIESLGWLRGPASLRYGSDPLIGVLRVEHSIIFVPVPPKAGGELNTSSGDEAGGGRLYTLGSRGTWEWSAAGTGRRGGILHDPGDHEVSTRSNTASGDAALRYRFATGTAGIRLSQDLGRFDDAGSNGSNRHRELGDGRVQLAGFTTASGHTLSFNAGWQRRSLDARDDPALGTARPRFDATSVELETRRDAGRVHTTAGVTGLAQRTEDSGSRPLLATGLVIAGGAYGIANALLGPVEIAAAARADVRHVTTEPSAALALLDEHRGFRDWTGSLAATWRARPDVTLSAQAGRSWRPPTIAELYSRGVVPGTNRFEVGGHGLDAERGFGVEAGADWRWRSLLQSAVRVYTRRIDQFITLEPVGAPGTDVVQYVNHDASLTGGEARLTAYLDDRFLLDGRLDYVSGQDRTADRPLSFVPTPRWGLGAGWRPRIHHDNRPPFVRVELEGHGRATRLGSLDRPIDPYVLVHLGAEHEWSDRHGTLRAILAVRNVANTSFTHDLAPTERADGEGRSFELRLVGTR